MKNSKIFLEQSGAFILLDGKTFKPKISPGRGAVPPGIFGSKTADFGELNDFHEFSEAGRIQNHSGKVYPGHRLSGNDLRLLAQAS